MRYPVTPYTSNSEPQKNILVTGGTGFVGSALVNRLLLENSHITVSLSDGKDNNILPEGVEGVIESPLSEVSDYSTSLVNKDVVIHLAARVHKLHDNVTDPLYEFRRVNVFSTKRLAQQAAKLGVKRFVFISTVKVHGEQTELPYREDSSYSPLDPYSISKAEAEVALWQVSGETGLEVVIVRPPLVYGPGVKANFLQLMNVVDHHIPLPLASIRNMRSLVYIENLVDAITCCAMHSEAAGQAYLVSDGEDISTPDLIRCVSLAIGKTAFLLPIPYGLMHFIAKIIGKSSYMERLAGSLLVDDSKIKTELGWTPPYTMMEGLEKTAEWFIRK